MCSSFVSAHGLKNVICSTLVSAHGIKESWYFAYRSRKIQFMKFVLRCRFQWLTNRLATFPFVPMVPIDHSFSHALQVLMRCSLQMVLTDRLKSLPFVPMVRIVRLF